MKKPFITKEQAVEIIKQYPTPFHIYDEKGIRENARNLNKAFSWNKGYKEYFAVKATPNPYILKILRLLQQVEVYYQTVLKESLAVLDQKTGKSLLLTTHKQDSVLLHACHTVVCV